MRETNGQFRQTLRKNLSQSFGRHSWLCWPKQLQDSFLLISSITQMLSRATAQVLGAVAHLADGTLPALCSQCISAVRASWKKNKMRIFLVKWFNLRLEYVDHAKRLGVKRLKLFPYLSWKENRREKNAKTPKAWRHANSETQTKGCLNLQLLHKIHSKPSPSKYLPCLPLY